MKTKCKQTKKLKRDKNNPNLKQERFIDIIVYSY